MVPAAMAMTGDQVPEAQRWNWLPPTQFQSPSEVQASPAAWAPELPPVPPVAEGVEGDEGTVGVPAALVVTVCMVLG